MNGRTFQGSYTFFTSAAYSEEVGKLINRFTNPDDHE